jgi:protein-disulfide isomerase
MRNPLLLLTPLSLALTVSAALSPSLSPAWADSFAPAQRQEIVGVLRDALRDDPSILRDALAALQADDARRQDQATSDVLSLLAPRLADPADPVAGNPLGDVTVVEFFDTRCPYCRRMLPVMADLLQSDKKVKLVLKDLPILGNASQLESRALLAAQRQGGYFKLHDAIMTAGAPPSRDSLRADAERVGLDGGRLLRDMDDPAIKERLANNLELAKQIGIDGTPAFVVGTRLIAGAAELPDLQSAVAAARKR